MFKLLHYILYLTCLVALPAVGRASGDPNDVQSATRRPDSAAEHAKPFFDAGTHTTEYAGPGRELPAPADVEEIRIGWFGPDDPNHPKAGAMWSAAVLAVEEANRAGGYNGLPFRLVAGWSDNPWGTGIKDLTRLVYDEEVWGIVGAPDGPSAHLVEQVVAKARLVFLNPVSTDKTTNFVNVPWIFSLAPPDDIQASVLADALVHGARCDGGPSLSSPLIEDGMRRVAVVSCTDHDSRVFTTELLAALKKINTFPTLHLEFRSAGTDLATALERIRQSHPTAVALIAGPEDSGRFLSELRADGLNMPVYGGPAMGHRLFVETAGRSAGGVQFPLLWDPAVAGEDSAAFFQPFRERFGIEPDYTAAYTYDAVNMLIGAVHRAGLNRARIRDAVRNLSPWEGVTGTIAWDPTGRNKHPVRLHTIPSTDMPPEVSP